jgi:predicted aconitase with swiveling domain
MVNAMDEKIMIRGRRLVGGRAEGEALVTSDNFSVLGGINLDGDIIDLRSELAGKNIKDKVFVFKGAKGSSAWSGAFHATKMAGNGPAAMLIKEINTKSASGAVVVRAPAMTDFDLDPCEIISTGDWVAVDADCGIVEVTKRRGTAL